MRDKISTAPSILDIPVFHIHKIDSCNMRHESDVDLSQSPDLFSSRDDEDSRPHPPPHSSRHRSRSQDRNHHRHQEYIDHDNPDNEVEEGQCFDDEEDEERDYYDDEDQDRCLEEDETPNKTIMIRGLPSRTNENDVSHFWLNMKSLHAINVFSLSMIDSCPFVSGFTRSQRRKIDEESRYWRVSWICVR